MKFTSKKQTGTAISLKSDTNSQNGLVHYAVDWSEFLESAIEEAVRNFVPNMRLQRIVSVIKSILSKITPEEQTKVNYNSNNDEHKAVLELAFSFALNTISEIKHKAIAQLIVFAMKDTKDNCINYIRFLHLLNQLDDIDLIILKYRVYTKYYPEKAPAFFEKYEKDLSLPDEEESSARKAIYNHRLIILRNLGFFSAKRQITDSTKPEGQVMLVVEPIAKYFVFAIGED